MSRYPDAHQLDGLVLFRWDAPLFFANAEAFREAIEAAVDAAQGPIQWVVVAAEPVTDVDMTAADMLDTLITELGVQGIKLRFAELKDPVKDHLRRYGLLERLGDEAFFPTLGTAVDGYVAASGIDWVDWEERPPGAPPSSGSSSVST
jgi:MFS superfamily sulfate permease-like transporter